MKTAERGQTREMIRKMDRKFNKYRVGQGY